MKRSHHLVQLALQSLEDLQEEPAVHKTKKRNKRPHPEAWKKNTQKKKRCAGEEYVGRGGKNKPYTVSELELEDFKDFTSLTKSSPFIARKRDTEGEAVLLSKAVHLMVEKCNLVSFKYKTSFDNEFKEVDLRRFKRKDLNFPHDIPAIRGNLRPISLA
ncbi:hypothetical protein C0J52_19492 [Blattella germanica]|nr:hypothetical protein C0J52_19492 [Blattella germanica]